MSDPARVKVLLSRLSENIASEEDVRDLLLLIKNNEYGETVREVAEKLWENFDTQKSLPLVDWDNMYASIVSTPINRRGKMRRIAQKVAIAAGIALIISVDLCLFIKKVPSPALLAKLPQEQRFKNDVQPGRNGAVLTLSNGQQVIIDSVHSGLIAIQGNASVVKQSGGLSYQSGDVSAAVVYNTLSTPRGRQFRNLILPDGSRVWLDAGSSIHFPTAFTGKERKVVVTGQVWFDVVHNAKMPFKVEVKGTEIEDLGTQFDINAYDDESSVKVTLLQGSIRLSTGNYASSVVLRPGQQAQIINNGGLAISNDVDVDEVMAWKEGIFICDDANITSVMKQIARWYDVEVVFKDFIDKRVSLLNVPRSVTLTQLLKIMEMTGNVKFLIDGKKVTVLSP